MLPPSSHPFVQFSYLHHIREKRTNTEGFCKVQRAYLLHKSTDYVAYTADAKKRDLYSNAARRTWG